MTDEIRDGKVVTVYRNGEAKVSVACRYDGEVCSLTACSAFACDVAHYLDHADGLYWRSPGEQAKKLDPEGAYWRRTEYRKTSATTLKKLARLGVGDVAMNARGK